MNPELKKYFERWYAPHLINNSSGASSVSGTALLRSRMLDLFREHKIYSVFDAGCNDCNWASLLAHYVRYLGGDISEPLIQNARNQYPELELQIHDVTTDPIPSVDLLLCRDVAIHLSTDHKQQLWNNWYRSGVPWILITHHYDQNANQEVVYTNTFPFGFVNWTLPPWNFPAPTHVLLDPQSNSLALWHRTQFEGIL